MALYKVNTRCREQGVYRLRRDYEAKARFPVQRFMVSARVAGLIEPGDTIALWGCGPMGLFTIQSALLQGAEHA